MADKKKRLQDAAAFGGGTVAAETAATEAAATHAMSEGMEAFRMVAEKLSERSAALRKGNLFEYIETAKFNADAARQDLAARAHVTAEIPGRGTDPRIDIEVRDGADSVLERFQAKASDDPQYAARELSSSKYAETMKLVPRDQAADVRARTGDDTVTGQLEHASASSGGTTIGELRYATDNPELYARLQESLQAARQAGVAGLQAAGAGIVLGGAISSIRNVYAYAQGDIDGRQATKNVAKDAAAAGMKSGSIGALGTVIRHGAAEVGIRSLTKSTIATAVAAGVIEAGSTIYAYAKGEISAEIAAERLGDTGCSTLSGLYTGAAAGAIFGPAGAVVGSVAGYLIATAVYQSCIAVFKEARLAEEEAARVVTLCAEAVKVMDEQRSAFEAKLESALGEQQTHFEASFKAIDKALKTDTPGDTVQALSYLMAICGRELHLARFTDFDRFMTESDAPLVL